MPKKKILKSKFFEYKQHKYQFIVSSVVGSSAAIEIVIISPKYYGYDDRFDRDGIKKEVKSNFRAESSESYSLRNTGKTTDDFLIEAHKGAISEINKLLEMEQGINADCYQLAAFTNVETSE